MVVAHSCLCYAVLLSLNCKRQKAESYSRAPRHRSSASLLAANIAHPSMRLFALRSLSPSVSLSHPLRRLALINNRTSVAEYPELKVFCVHPGIVATELTVEYEGRTSRDLDSPALCASTTLYLASGKADYLSGRFVASTWDQGEVERDWKEKIIAQNALVSKLHIPQ